MHAILSLVFDVVTLMDLYLTSVFGFYFVGRLKATRGFFFYCPETTVLECFNLKVPPKKCVKKCTLIYMELNHIHFAVTKRFRIANKNVRTIRLSHAL